MWAPTPMPIDDFADLDAEIAQAMEAKAERAALAAKRKRLEILARRGTPDAEIEHRLLLAVIRKVEDGMVWRTEDAVVLFHTQTCLTCGSRHRLFMGWMTGQAHITDRTAHRLLKGRPPQPLPIRIVEHDLGPAEMCSDCAESCLIIEKAIENAKDARPCELRRSPSPASETDDTVN